ncbi:FAD-linked oxidase C-terminal domain-containing protein [Lentisphaera profundi]|uniref:FAD-linked oxidase C-terminal domain-containing protein n=1 Tax=Lentisphaera profundi TaxID=1658616 RepID=A0ABY7VPQ2_9BACT|nr:FAD-linked oxidase C-terminal domain-containing protein [Lentisphaera profundi]WDE95279.1 FAD-linked oxidase C-terminal domain-containing protein [Lentisphaera profundi]
MDLHTEKIQWQDTWTQALKKACPQAQVLTDQAELTVYENDGLGFHRYLPDCVIIVNNADEIAPILKVAQDCGFPYTVRGAGTSLSGGPVALEGGLIIHLSRLNKVLEINPDDMYCVVEPGLVLNRLNTHLKEHALFYPPDPSSGFASTLGGNVAENAGGIRCFRYGVTANYVLGMEVIQQDGQLVRFGGPSAQGGSVGTFHWNSLMVGSEGTLGIITKIWLKLKPIPEKVWTFLAEYKDLQSCTKAINELVHMPTPPVAIEFIDNAVVQLVENSNMAVGIDKKSWVILTEIDGPAPLVDCRVEQVKQILQSHDATKVSAEDDDEKRLKLWKARKVAGGLMGQLSPGLMIQDAVIPRAHLQEVLQYIYDLGDELDIPVLNVFHAGDGNLHPNFLFDDRVPEEMKNIKTLSNKLIAKVIELGGTLSGEHGLGNDKSCYLDQIFSPEEIDFQMSLLRALNINDQMNPGKIIPQRSFVGCCAPHKHERKA